MGEARTTVLDARNVAKVYAAGTRALDHVDLAIHAGEFVTLLGPSGCGKTTLLQLFAGLDVPSSGELFRAAPAPGLGDAPRPAPIGYVFQTPTLMPWARVDANVRLPLDLARVPRASADAAVDGALARVGLATFARAYPRELSGGMRMRVSIARALVTQPALMLLDEPFGALDEWGRARLDDVLVDVWQRAALTVVFVTHSIAEAVYLSTRIVVMAARPGRIVDDVPIDAPYPRGIAWRGSPAFARHCVALSERVSQAAAGGDG